MTAELIIEGQPPWVAVPIELLTDTRITTTARVLFSILLWHGQTPERCFPGHARLAELAGIAERSVALPLRQLEEAGWISRHRRNDKHGQRTSDGYTLHLTVKAADTSSVPSAQLSASQARSPARAKRAPTRGEQSSRGTRGREQPTRATDESVSDESAQPLRLLTETGEREKNPVQEFFDEWWDAYPRKIAKRAARNAFAQAIKRHGGMEKADPVISEGTGRWNIHWKRESTALQHIPYPATWLNGDYFTTIPDRTTRRA